MKIEESVTRWIDGLRQGSPNSAQLLWERYFQQLVRLASHKLPTGVKRGFDEEDVALSAFHSLCRGVQQGRFPQLEDRDNLWSLLVAITARKAMHQLRDATAAKRGSGQVRGESAFGPDDEAHGIDQAIGRQPTAEFALQVSEETGRLFALLPDENMRQIAALKMEGYSNEEIAAKLRGGLRTVERRLALIRKVWRSRSDECT